MTQFKSRNLKLAIVGQLLLTALPMTVIAQEGRRGPPPEMKKAMDACAAKAGIAVGEDPRAAMKNATEEQRQALHECMEANRPAGHRGGPRGPRPDGERPHGPPPPLPEASESGTGQ